MSRSPFVRHRNLVNDAEEDPLAGVANLFDAAMVFAVALLLAFVTYAGAQSLSPGAEAHPDRERGEVPAKDWETLTRFRTSSRTTGGKGKRLGVAYRLESGELIYVPDR
ncbi:MAG: DUF2149 domain-containing protein [Planctomycetota bacterium]